MFVDQQLYILSPKTGGGHRIAQVSRTSARAVARHPNTVSLGKLILAVWPRCSLSRATETSRSQRAWRVRDHELS